MEYIKIPETTRIGGKEAIQSLNEYINELEQEKGDELTKKQKTAMIKFARGLIVSIENEMQDKTVQKQPVKVSIVKQIKAAIQKGFSEFRSANDDGVKPVDSTINH